MDIWDNMKHTDICIIGTLEGEKEIKEHEPYLKK